MQNILSLLNKKLTALMERQGEKMEALYKAISDLGKQYSAEKIVLFGSRARGDNNEKSDIDIAVFRMPTDNQIAFAQAVESLPTLLQFDIVFITERTNQLLLENINRDGVILMNKFDEKLEKFSEAVKRLTEALEEYEKYAISSSRDGVIQRFEFCTELAWKSAREFLISEGYVDLNSPKAVLKQAYANNIIDDEKAWLELLYSRNLTSHIYDDCTASDIFINIKDKYLLLFKQLIDVLKSK